MSDTDTGQSYEDRQNPLTMENRDLKSQISALREALEQERIQSEDRVQKAVAGLNDEIVHLKDTISALRDTLEECTIAHEQHIQDIKKKEHDEKEHLKETIVTLRKRMEKRK